MLSKPSSCVGCPLYGDGLGFVPDQIVPGAAVMVLMQNPGKDEEEGRKVVALDERGKPHYERCDPTPAIGRTGHYMDTKFLPLAELERGRNVSVANVLKCRLQEDSTRTNDLPTGERLRLAVVHCTTAHLRIPAGTRAVIAQGALAWDYTQQQVGQPDTRKWSISNWRGSVGPRTLQTAGPTSASSTEPSSTSVPVLAVLHLADLFRDRKMELPSRQDWKRLPALLRGDWPILLPSPLVIAASTTEETVNEWFNRADQHAPWFSIDVEFVPETRLLTILGIGYQDAGLQIHGLQLEWLNREIPSSLRAITIRRLARLLSRIKAVGWNVKDAELPVLEKNLNITLTNFEDGMLAHAALWCELPHDLEFCCSVYSDYEKPKKEVVGWGLTKNWGDVVGTIRCWTALLSSLRSDPAVEQDYREQRLPLVPLLRRADEAGLRINKPRVLAALREYGEQLEGAQAMAEAYCGWPLNLGSPAQLAHWLYTVEPLPAQRKRRTRKLSVDDDAIAELRNNLDPVPDTEEERDGLTLEAALRRIEAGGHPLLESRVVFAGARQVTSHYLQPCLNKGVESLSLLSLASVGDRLYPHTAIHSQDNGRWSITSPPLGQLPKALRNLILPDEGSIWVHWDWNSAEPRLQMATMHSTFLANVIGKGWDKNTIAVCQLLGWLLPPDVSDPHTSPACAEWRAAHNWGGKDDPRRRLVKAGLLSLDYGKFDLSTLPGVSKLGLSKDALKRGGETILTSDPDKARWMAGIRTRVKRGENLSRDWTGARRVFLGTVGDSRVREWLNHPFQRGVASLLNLTTVQLARECPGYLAWSMHDAGNWALPARSGWQGDMAAIIQTIQSIVEQPRTIGDQRTPFPSTWSVIDDTGAEHTIKEYCA